MQSVPVPTPLTEIPQPPKQLYVRGTLPDLDTYRYLAVVGAREFTSYGKQVCEALIRGLRGYPVCIVSGLALGIDGIAHKAALEAGLPTVAVPGSGLNDQVLYPASHRRLARDILDSGGALLSEFEPMYRARPESFPQRNRIMAGLSRATLVVEAAEKSGTLITARLSLDYNRDVLVVPGPVTSVTSAGPHMLLRTGAALVRNSEDILEALGIDAASTTLKHTELSESEARVCAILATGPLSRDELIRALNMPPTEANVLLSSMELKGIIYEVLGKVTI
jgi:DNA processing protein